MRYFSLNTHTGSNLTRNMKKKIILNPWLKNRRFVSGEKVLNGFKVPFQPTNSVSTLGTFNLNFYSNKPLSFTLNRFKALQKTLTLFPNEQLAFFSTNTILRFYTCLSNYFYLSLFLLRLPQSSSTLKPSIKTLYTRSRLTASSKLFFL